ncbi:helix-turn-helix transcriptional regulator [Nocardioides humilatus]|uniref:Helix-turn-helix transcriptional regulator n=2 Tax=Nocardioides humilatus TaxID=2607660 RepID=A0A5B1LI58_9ACTN|nr:helix-turn-helix transcriptional regulator [Nocardioides humilatus]
MSETGTTQSELSRISGVKQPSLSQFLSGRVEMSDDMLDRLLSCMGYRLEVVRRPIRRDLGRSPERSWRLHRELSKHLTHSTLKIWEPTIRRNLGRLLSSVQGEPHIGNLGRWRRLVDERDITQLRRMMTGRDTDSIQMREVSPLGGLLSQDERSRALERVG